MNTLTITSPEALDASVAAVVRLKIQHTAAVADMEAEIAAVQKRHTPAITKLAEDIARQEADIQDYCAANRPVLFPEKKSRECPAAVFGFEFTPWRVETRKKITAAEAIKRLLRTTWGKVYVRTPTKKTLDKEALLKDREKLKDEQLTAAGIVFEQDEQFFIRPKSESAEPTAQPA